MFRKAVLIGFILGLVPALNGAASALTLQEALAQARENLPSYQAAKKKVRIVGRPLRGGARPLPPQP